MDHIQPKASGGDDREANLRGICQSCHREKSLLDTS
ncbi:HNH endonuclease [Hahella aquimaris]